MRILVIGGAGYVGAIVLPYLAQHHTLRVFDLRPPTEPSWEYVAGGVDDVAALTAAAAGVDALIYMAMGDKRFDTVAGISTNFDVNVKGVYLALYAAHQAGVNHAIYISSMSVYAQDLRTRPLADEDLPPDCTQMYGLTKRLGEVVCAAAVHEWGLSVNALRLFLPMSEAEWQAVARQQSTAVFATTAEDVARALLAALDYRNGFETFAITGDFEQRHMVMGKAQRLLDWEPLARPSA